MNYAEVLRVINVSHTLTLSLGQRVRVNGLTST